MFNPTVPHESVEAEDGSARFDWHCGLAVKDYRIARPYCDQDEYLFGKKVLRWLEGNQTFTRQQIQEQADYMKNPAAFWMRPDGDYLSDEPYVPVERVYVVQREETAEIELT